MSVWIMYKCLASEGKGCGLYLLWERHGSIIACVVCTRCLIPDEHFACFQFCLRRERMFEWRSGSWQSKFREHEIKKCWIVASKVSVITFPVLGVLIREPPCVRAASQPVRTKSSTKHFWPVLGLVPHKSNRHQASDTGLRYRRWRMHISLIRTRTQLLLCPVRLKTTTLLTLYDRTLVLSRQMKLLFLLESMTLSRRAPSSPQTPNSWNQISFWIELMRLPCAA